MCAVLEGMGCVRHALEVHLAPAARSVPAVPHVAKGYSSPLSITIITVASLYLHCTITVPSLYHHDTITVPSRYHHGTITVPSLCYHRTITVPSWYQHRPITVPSWYHHCTIMTPVPAASSSKLRRDPKEPESAGVASIPCGAGSARKSNIDD